MDIDYFELFVKLALGFAAFVLQISLAGRGNLAPSNAIDQLQNFVLGGIIGGILYNPSITTLQFFIVLLIWSTIVFGARFLANHNNLARRILIGQPHTIVHNGKIDTDFATRAGISAQELAFQLRQHGASNLEKVKRAVLETNGTLTVTLQNDPTAYYPVILDGQVDEDALDIIHRDRDWLDAQLESHHIEMSHVYMAIYQDNQLQITQY
jgi:uncharacterized membrane protein YcaP (DUF421 family)